MQDKKLNYKQASEVLGIGVNTLYAWVSMKKIPHIRMGSRIVRFSYVELEAWMSCRKVLAANAKSIDGARQV